jgi:hypothetical protein
MGHHRKKKHRRQAEPTPQPTDMNAFANLNLASLFQILNTIDISQFTGLLSQLNIDPKDERNVLKEGDPRIDLLNSLKPFLPPDKNNVVDDVINFFSPKPENEQAPQQQAPQPENNADNISNVPDFENIYKEVPEKVKTEMESPVDENVEKKE